MRNTIVLLLLLVACPAIYAQSDIPHVEVLGTAKREVPPDEIHWRISIETTDSEVAEVSSRHSASVSKVLEYLRSEEIDQEALKTSRIHLSENWIYRSSSRIRDGFRASTEISFKSTDLTSYEHLWAELSQFEGISIDNVFFDVSGRIQLQNEVRIDALKMAKEKATSMAAALGLTILEPIRIEEIQDPYLVNPMVNVVSRGGGDGEEVDSTAPGLESITCRVKVVFRLSSN